ncbi:restriction endonuclease [Actinokineospora guangxiensis]|uniref:Restriction endonuclease n=1 Tax=Actinokineospora guangxiensis TaxID=1490288 RepID=A0ABW0EWT0_9PSEU
MRNAYGASADEPVVDGYPNVHHLLAAQDGVRISLSSGINLTKKVGATDGPRRPVLVLRSSPWKAGQESTPWHDVYDLDNGYVRYYGDHKVDDGLAFGSSRGNAALAETRTAHGGVTPDERLQAVPLLLLRSVTVGKVVKGHVEFCGLAVMERLEYVVQRDPRSSRSFANFAFDLAVLNLAEDGDQLDLRWLDDRRDTSLSSAETLRFAPKAWREWIELGEPALPRLRRRVATSKVRTAAEQRPTPGSAEDRLLGKIYQHFDRNKHQFELLASQVAGSLLRSRGGVYHEGWVTRGSGDGGADFVGRLDAGGGDAMVRLVVLGQAKCILPTNSVSAEQIARVVARLRRGWIGVYVTTGVFSRAAQLEIIEDQYPILLIDGRHLSDEVRRMSFISHGGDVDALLDDISATYASKISARRPEEIVMM